MNDRLTIKQYETASKRSQDGYDITILHNLCRAWYAKANKDQSYLAIKNALEFGQKALHITPNEKVNLYNVAMIEQKGLEMLLAIQPAKRTLTDLNRAVAQGVHAQKCVSEPEEIIILTIHLPGCSRLSLLIGRPTYHTTGMSPTNAGNMVTA